jgi:ketosteroid isomerase-like protein
MSHENVELVREVYEGWSRGDFSQIEAFDPEIDFEMVDWPHQTRARGISMAAHRARPGACLDNEAMWRTWRATLSAWVDFRALPTEYVDCGRNVLVLNRIQGSGKESGAGVSADTATVWTVEAGRVVRLALYWDTVAAREAAEREP